MFSNDRLWLPTFYIGRECITVSNCSEDAEKEVIDEGKDKIMMWHIQNYVQ